MSTSTPLRGCDEQNFGGVRQTLPCQAFPITLRACRSCRQWQESDLPMMSDSGGRTSSQPHGAPVAPTGKRDCPPQHTARTTFHNRNTLLFLLETSWLRPSVPHQLGNLRTLTRSCTRTATQTEAIEAAPLKIWGLRETMRSPFGSGVWGWNHNPHGLMGLRVTDGLSMEKKSSQT